MKFFILYLAAVSILSCIVTVHDKISAKKGKRRVPEKILFLLAAVGGSATMYITMLIIRHKTRHKRFMIGLPAIFILQCFLLILVTQKINVSSLILPF